MENELTVYESKSPSELIAMALDKQADPNVLSKLMDLQERWEAQNARKAYVLAMTAFKQEAPAVLKKNDRVDFTTQKGRTVYNYANLGSIVQEIAALLGKHELSAAWETAQTDKGMIRVSCHITHSAGHRETVTLEGPADISGNKNAIQAIGSSVTYLQRYTLLAALGLATTEDDDGRQGIDNPPIQMPQEKKNGDQKSKDTETLITLVDNVTMKEGKNDKGKPWTKYTIHVGDKGYSTFDKNIAKDADQAKKSAVNVNLEFKNTTYGPEIVSLTIQGPPEPGSEG